MDATLENLVAVGKIDRTSAEKIDQLRPGVFCIHKSWGVGRIKEWDLLGLKLKVDFEDKPGHFMALKFAASSLEILPDDHFLTRRLTDLEGLQALAKDEPANLVRLALESSGGTLKLDSLDDMLKGRIIPEGRYKNWWDGAKKKLRADRQFVVPSKRSEPLELRAADFSPSEALLDDFKGTRDLKEKAKRVEAIIKDLSIFDKPAEDLLEVVETINDAARKGLKLNLGPSVELMLARNELQEKVPELKFDESQITLEEVLKTQRERLAEMLNALAVSKQREVFKEFPSAFGDEWMDEAYRLLNECTARTISEIAHLLIEQGKTAEFEEFLVKSLQQRSLSSEALAWICKERSGAAQPVFDSELAASLMNILEAEHYDEEGKKSNRIHDLLIDDRELIPDLVRGANLNTVRHFARRLLMTPVFEELNRRSLLARIVKIHPEIQELITGKPDEREDITLIVSWDSFQKRKRDYDELVNKRIPENRKDIQIARSYGDLRENFEYKSAKEQQRVLMRRKAEWENDLNVAKPTDFKGADTAEVSIGSVVDLETADGRKQNFTILGAWDSDPANGVISYLSEVGKSLLTTKVGDTVILKLTETGEPHEYKITGIRAYAS